MAVGGRQLRLARTKTAHGGRARLAGSEEGGWVYTEHDPESEMEIPIIRFQSMTAHNGGRSRRDFFYLAGTIAVGTTCGQNRVKAVEPESPQIGILLATTFTTGTLEARLDAARACGLACVQMSMVCANLPEMPDQIPAELPERIRREASARGYRSQESRNGFSPPCRGHALGAAQKQVGQMFRMSATAPLRGALWARLCQNAHAESGPEGTP